MNPPALVTGPAELPVSLEQLKREAIVTFTDDDLRLDALLNAAVSYLDGWSGVLGRCMVAQQWRQTFEDWETRLVLPFPNVSAVTLTYLDTAGVEQTVSSSDYAVRETRKTAEIVLFGTFASPTLQEDAVDRIRADFTAGYGPAAAVPWGLRVQIMRLVRHWYDEPEGFPAGFFGAIAPFRCKRL